MCAGHALRAGLGKSRAVCYSKQATSNNAMRAMHGRPGGYEHKRASAALQVLRMEQPFAAPCALHLYSFVFIRIFRFLLQ